MNLIKPGSVPAPMAPPVGSVPAMAGSIRHVAQSVGGPMHSHLGHFGAQSVLRAGHNTSGSFNQKGARGLNKAVSNSHGQFRAKAQAAGMSTAAYASKEAHAPGKLGKQARLAKTLMGFHGK